MEIIGPHNLDEVEALLISALQEGLNFKVQEKVATATLAPGEHHQFFEEFPEKGISTRELLSEFRTRLLPYCTNFGSPKFMGFPDAGNSVAAVAGGILATLVNQNLINQSFCSPVGTLAEISVIQWLRETVGYDIRKDIRDIWDVGGIIMPGGTGSNAVGMMLARENRFPGTMQNGIQNLDGMHIVVPEGIGHYSVKSAQMWMGAGNRLIEVPTKDFRYDLDQLKGIVKDRKEQVMAVVGYCGDSRTMTVEDFQAVHDIVRAEDQGIWLHADACHGFSLGFSPQLRHMIKGIEQFDSITTDPHKVMAIPYVISSLLVRDPAALRSITSLADLIMQEPFAFGQITPFLGTRSWNSLKLWMMMKNAGREGLAELVNHRHGMALYLEAKLNADNRFKVINKVGINSVAFMYVDGIEGNDIPRLNAVNKRIHDVMLQQGDYHLHQFSIPDAGEFEKGAVIYPLRFMTGNMLITPEIIDDMIEYVCKLGNQVANG